MLGEPLSIEFANTHYAVRGRPREGIGTEEHLSAWLRDNAGVTGIDALDVDSFVALRDTIRGIATAITEDEVPSADLISRLNLASAAANRWPVLTVRGAEFSISETSDGDVGRAALAAIARDAIRIFGGPERDTLRACRAPGCVLFFVKNHARREWCSGSCGNRVRAARHYLRHKDES